MDVRKAFDVIPHAFLKFKLHNTGINRSLWAFTYNLYSATREVICWKGKDSREYFVGRGEKQGGVTSTDHYKLFQNGAMLALQSSGMGFHIGSTLVGLHTMADDELIISNNHFQLQAIFNSRLMTT